MWSKSKQPLVLVEKLRRIVLASAPLVELDPVVAQIFDLWRKLTRHEIAEADAARQLQAWTTGDRTEAAWRQFIWEPLSDTVGDPILHYGWEINATLYLANGQPWWLVRANHNRARTGPSDNDKKQLAKVVERLGARDPARDLLYVMNHEELRWAHYYAWFHHGPLLETHVNARTRDLRIEEEGTPLADGFERVPRLDINNLPLPPTAEIKKES